MCRTLRHVLHFGGDSLHTRGLAGTFDQHFDIAADGSLRGVSLPRWGNPHEQPFDYYAFGGTTAEPVTVDGITVPTVHRVGWYYGTDRFEAEGEFFRCTLTSVRFKL